MMDMTALQGLLGLQTIDNQGIAKSKSSNGDVMNSFQSLLVNNLSNYHKNSVTPQNVNNVLNDNLQENGEVADFMMNLLSQNQGQVDGTMMGTAFLEKLLNLGYGPDGFDNFDISNEILEGEGNPIMRLFDADFADGSMDADFADGSMDADFADGSMDAGDLIMNQSALKAAGTNMGLLGMDNVANSNDLMGLNSMTEMVGMARMAELTGTKASGIANDISDLGNRGETWFAAVGNGNDVDDMSMMLSNQLPGKTGFTGKDNGNFEIKMSDMAMTGAEMANSDVHSSVAMISKDLQLNGSAADVNAKLQADNDIVTSDAINDEADFSAKVLSEASNNDVENNVKNTSNMSSDAEFAKSQSISLEDTSRSAVETVKTQDGALNQSSKVYEQVAQYVLKNIQSNKGNSITMQLYPETLGKIDVKMAFSEGRLIIDILAASNETHKLLVSQSEKLIRALGLANVEVSGINVANNTIQTSHNQDSNVHNGQNQMQNMQDMGEAQAQKDGQNHGGRGQATAHSTKAASDSNSGQLSKEQQQIAEMVSIMRQNAYRLNYFA